MIDDISEISAKRKSSVRLVISGKTPKTLKSVTILVKSYFYIFMACGPYLAFYVEIMLSNSKIKRINPN